MNLLEVLIQSILMQHRYRYIEKLIVSFQKVIPWNILFHSLKPWHPATGTSPKSIVKFWSWLALWLSIKGEAESMHASKLVHKVKLVIWVLLMLWGWVKLVSHGQTLFSCRGKIDFSISALCKKGSGRVYGTYSYWGQQILLGINWFHVTLYKHLYFSR